MIDEYTLSQIHAIQSPEEERAKAEKLPEWVKCMYCGKRPSWSDLLCEVVPNSSALAHQSCLAARGKITGLNSGLTTEIGGKNDISRS